MGAPRAPGRALAALLGALLAAGCAAERGSLLPGAGPERPSVNATAGPQGWTLRLLHGLPPYLLVEYVEPGMPGVPDESRSRVRIGKAEDPEGRRIVASLCDAQWRGETALAPSPVGRTPLEVRRGGATYRGWEAQRALRDGSMMRLRAVCGDGGGLAAFFFLSAPDRSGLYEPVWEDLLTLNLGAPEEP